MNNNTHERNLKKLLTQARMKMSGLEDKIRKSLETKGHCLFDGGLDSILHEIMAKAGKPYHGGEDGDGFWEIYDPAKAELEALADRIQVKCSHQHQRTEDHQ